MYRRVLSLKAVVIFPVLLLFFLMVFSVEIANFEHGMDVIGYDGVIGPDPDWREIEVGPITRSGYVQQDSSIKYQFQLDDVKTNSFHIHLQWNDEPSLQFYENRPDEFRITVISPNGNRHTSPFHSNTMDQPGDIHFSVQLEDIQWEFGTWTVLVEAGNCGDQVAMFRTIEDNGNQYTMDISYIHLESYYKETWTSWRGIVQTTTGLLSIVVGLFLLNVASKSSTIAEMLKGNKYPVFLAGLLFLFNGMALFTDGSSGFIWDQRYYLWSTFLGITFYTITYPLLALFPLYYPRTIDKRLDPFHIRLKLLLVMLFFIALFWLTHATHKEWYYTWQGLIAFKYDQIWVLINSIYYLGIITCLLVFTYWYKSKATTRSEKNALAFILAGFIFSPLNRWCLDFDTIIEFNVIARNIEASLATLIAIYLITTGILGMLKQQRIVKRDVILISAIIISWILYLNKDKMIFGLEGMTLGFSFVRPLCFALAILQFKLFNINITQRIILYTSLSLLIGVIFFSIKNGLQQSIPALGVLSIFLMTILFIPLSAFTNYFSERFASRITRFLNIPQDKDEQGRPVSVEKKEPLRKHFTDLLEPKTLMLIFFFSLFIEMLETFLTNEIDYPALISIVLVGMLFSVVDYLIESNILGTGSVEVALMTE